MKTLTPVIVPVPQGDDDRGGSRDTEAERPKSPPRTPAAVRRQRESARLALVRCAQRYGAPTEGWEQDDADRPVPNDGYYWSVSHARRLAAAVIADRPVGIDIEEIRPRDRELHDALAGPAEWAVLAERSWRAFFRLWTAKEATLKANGVGIAELLDCRLVTVVSDHRLTLEFRDRTWCVQQFDHANHIAAVTCDNASVEWEVLK